MSTRNFTHAELLCSYDNVAMLPELNQEDLDNMDITLPGHRKFLLKRGKRPPQSMAASKHDDLTNRF
jgi:hypothetical protein